MDIGRFTEGHRPGVKRNNDGERSSESLSTKFAYLPNGIIREIIAYTGAKYKKRNGKYMGQIPKNDPRFTLLSNIPKKQINIFFVNNEYTYFSSKVMLLENDRNDIYTIELHVIGINKNNQSNLASVNTSTYRTHFIVDDGNNNRRQYLYCEEKRTEPRPYTLSGCLHGLRRFLDSLSRIFYENPTTNEKIYR